MIDRVSRAHVWVRATLICAVTSAILALVPFVAGAYLLHVLAIGAYYVILAVSWNLLAGYTARYSLAQQAFSATGAYTTGLLLYYVSVPIWVGIVAAVLVATALGLLMGVLVLRMEPAYLSLATWSLAATLEIALAAAYEFTRGRLGLYVPALVVPPDPVVYYWIFLGLAAISVLLMYFLVESRVGRFMRAIRDDELRAKTLGVDTTRWKIVVFAVTSAFSGLAGAFYAHYILVLSPGIAGFNEMGKVIAMTVGGGLGSFIGPIIGAPLINLILEYLQQYGQWAGILYAVVVILVVRFYPPGLAGLIDAAIRRFRPRSRSEKPARSALKHEGGKP